MLNRSLFHNSRGDGSAVLEIVANDGAQGARFVPLRTSELTGSVAGPLADLTLTQHFRYGAAECDRPLEALYRFPLPGDAAVLGVCVRFGEVVVRTRLAPRGAAEEEYRRARSEGQQAALATRESPDVFTLQLTGLRPDEDVRVETHYVQCVRAGRDGWALRVPLTTAPRYVRGDELTSRHAQGQPLALWRDPGHRFVLDVMIQGAEAVQSRTHRLDVAPEGGALRARLEGGEALPDRDLELTWRTRREAERPTLRTFAAPSEERDEVHLLVLVSAPEAAAPATAGPPREVTLLVDHSGSMSGPKWEAADWAVNRFLSDLGPQESFALGVFHSTTRWFSSRLQPADPERVPAAAAFLAAEQSSGGTELGVALEQALAIPPRPGAGARHVLVITDAQVSDAGRLLRLVDREASRAGGRRVSVLCIDAASNDYLAREIARRGGGVARFLTSSPDQVDITSALDGLLAEWAAPLWADLRLEADRPSLLASGRRAAAAGQGVSSVDLGPLAAGQTQEVVACVPGGAEPLTLTLRDGAGTVLATQQIALGAGAPAWPAVRALYGAGRLLDLEFLLHSGRDRAGLEEELRLLGYDPQEALATAAPGPAPIYAENVRGDAEATLRALLVRESLFYGLPCAETAFIGVREERGQRVAGTVLVANALPSGWSEEFLAPTQPAAGGSLLRARMASLPAYRGLAASLREVRLGDLGEEQPEAPARSGAAQVFAEVPRLHYRDGEALLFCASVGDAHGPLPAPCTLRWLEVVLRPDDRGVDRGLLLRILVDGAEAAYVGLADLLQQGGRRPLNITLGRGQTVDIVLFDPHGAWVGEAPRLFLRLGW
jgi:Ca-activated chloride channel family protein